MKKVILASVIASSVLMAGGYKLPETSTNAIALSSANVAHTTGADASYYNPANMVFMSDNNEIEVDLTYIGLSDIKYKGTSTNALGTVSADTASEKENFIIPTIFYVSPEISGARFGMSVVSPGGLSKRWKDQPAKGKAEEFTLQVVELNPTVAYPINDKVAIALGLRLIHTSGIVTATVEAGPATMLSQDLTGDSIDFGYNLALSYKPTSNIDIGVTYRSNIDLTVSGDADVYANAAVAGAAAIDPKINTDASVTIPLPAALNLAIAYTLPTKTTIEFVYERTFWSSYKNLNFDFGDARAEAIFGNSSEKDWSDVSAYRLGITQEMDNLTLMCGIVKDESPIPNTTLSFELPDSDSISVSLGARYQVNKELSVALSGLYSMREDRKVDNTTATDGLTGEFTDSTATLISLGVGYKF